MDSHVLFFDGCSKGNPGLAGAGAVIYKNGIEIWSQAFFVGEKKTNNEAEYSGLIGGLAAAVAQNLSNLEVKGDSLLVIKQMKGEYKVKAANIAVLHGHARALEKKIGKVTYSHVYRADNKRADELSNQGIIVNK
jgi:ribonuclease HI